MNVLITGGTGFIGTRLALRCLERGDNVRVLGQVNTNAEGQNRLLIEDRGVECLMGSVADQDLLERAVAGIDVVYHLAAAQHEMNVPDQKFRDVNVEGTRKLLDACIHHRVGRFVHGSTIGVYGKLDGEID
jgi:nucleoside-diphosphate-sugar epimerase